MTLSITVLSARCRFIIILSVIMVSVVMLNVIMLSVVAPPTHMSGALTHLLAKNILGLEYSPESHPGFQCYKTFYSRNKRMFVLG
jgi:hypothetical protein